MTNKTQVLAIFTAIMLTGTITTFPAYADGGDDTGVTGMTGTTGKAGLTGLTEDQMKEWTVE